LFPHIGKILRFVGKLVLTSQDGFYGKTYLFKNIICEKYNITIDHCWVSDGVQIKKEELKINDIIEFDSKCNVYAKHGETEIVYDIGLSTPKNITKLVK